MLALEEWVNLWKEARNESKFNSKANEKVLEIWGKDPARFYRNAESWKNVALGYRRKDMLYKGERKYENALLGGRSVLTNSKSCEMKLEVKHNAFPLANKKRGQTITDCLGVLYDTKRGRSHPIAIEIKVTANNPWYAVVETLQQIRLMRAGVTEFQRYFREQIKQENVKGAWGMVLAPDSYYARNNGKAKGSYEAACKLCDFMKKYSDARVIIASIDLNSNSELIKLNYKAGYWPT